MNHGTIAEGYFRKGYNCAQSVLLAFGDLTGLDDDTATRIASSFGGGLGRMREVCGAVSGAAMVLGLMRGSGDPSDHAAKTAQYRLVQEFARRFRERNGSIVCRELLCSVETADGNAPEERTPAYYKKRPCAALCRDAAQLLDEMLGQS